MFGKLEHIGIAVKDLEASVALYETITGVKCYKREVVDSEGVITAFFKIGDTKLELLQATREESPITKFIEKKGEGLHHMAFDVEDIVSEMARLKSLGMQLINEEPKSGADNKIICFLHPKSANGVLVELCQDKK